MPKILLEPALAVLLWGVVFTAAKVGMRDIPPLTFTVTRILLASLLLVGLLVLTRQARNWRQLPWRALLSVGLAQTAFQMLFMQGIDRTSAGVSAVLLATSPLLTAAWLAARGRQQLAGRQWAGLVIGVAGVVLVMGADGLNFGTTLLGNLIAFGAAIAWAWYSLAIGPVSKAVGSITAATSSLLVAMVLLAGFAIPQAAATNWGAVSPVAWAGLLYGATLGLAAPTVLWVRGVQRYGAQATINYGYAEPVMAVAIAALLLGETLRPLQIVGAVLALAGVFLASAPPAPVAQTQTAKVA